MPTLQMLDVAIGMTFTFLLISLICTACNELLESWLKYRAKYLEQGIRELLGAPTASQVNKQAKQAKKQADAPDPNAAAANPDPAGNPLDYAAKLYQHPLVNSLFTGSYVPACRNLPSYVPARTFALAIMDVLVPATATTGGGTQDAAPLADNVGNVAEPPVAPVAPVAPPPPSPGSLAAFRAAVAKLPDSKLRVAVLALTDAAGDDMAAVRTNIENWYNSSMDRVAGWYKRRAQLITLLLGLAIAGFLNADAIALFKSLANSRALRDSLVAAATAQVRDGMPAASLDKTLTQLEDLKLPIGWYGDWPPQPAAPQAAGAKATSAVRPPADTTRKPVGQHDTTKKELPGDRRQSGSGRAGAPSPESPGADVAAWQQANRKLALPTTTADWLLKVLGLLITGVAVSLGSPFWFDVLNKFVVVRSTVKPHEKSPEEASDDR